MCTSWFDNHFKIAYLEILTLLARSRSVISLILEVVLEPSFPDIELVNTFFGKLRYGPVSTSLP